jgi:hypothetical protein
VVVASSVGSLLSALVEASVGLLVDSSLSSVGSASEVTWVVETPAGSTTAFVVEASSTLEVDFSEDSDFSDEVEAEEVLEDFWDEVELVEVVSF